MPSNPKHRRVLLRPPADFGQKSIPVSRQPARVWFRVHREEVSPLEFGLQPFHRFSHADCPWPMLYLGLSIQTCLWEVFGDDVFQNHRVIAASKWAGRCVSRVSVPELRMCAASLEKTRDAMGVDKGSLLASDLSVPQEWGLAIQRHPSGFQAIKYTSRFVDQPCLALFDRDQLKTSLKAKVLGGLRDVDEAVDWLHDRKAALV